MSKFQIVEKADYGTDWALVRYNDAAMKRYESADEAIKVAKAYVTDLNINNALATSEIEASSEAFLMDDKGVFLGYLDSKAQQPLYMKHEKNWSDKKTGVAYNKGDIVNSRNYDRLREKIEVSVRVVPGT